MFNPTRTSILLALLGSGATGNTITADVHGVGADYFDAGLHTFKCHVVPTDGSQEFFTGCSRDQAHSLGGGGPVTLELGPSTTTADFTLAQQEADLDIVRPSTVILKATHDGGRRVRKQVPDGARSNLVMLINYADMDVTYATEASARVMMQNPNGMDVDELYQATSYGRQSWPASETTVITINSPLSGADQTGCPFMAMSQATDLLIAAQHPNINLGDYIHRSYLIPSQVPGCGWGGVAYVNSCGGSGGTYCKAWIRMSSATVLAHELGHNLGTIHAADDYDDNGVQGAEYGDWGCVMGRAGWTSMNAPHRELLGYLGDDNGIETYDMACAARSSPQVSLTISRLDLTPGASNPNPNMVKIARFPSSNYLLSFKALADWDGATINGNYRDRLQIHNHDGSRVNTMIVKALADGETFTGAANRDGSSVPLTITVTDISTDTITVTIDTDCGTDSPTQTGETYAPSPAPTQPQNFRGDVVCGETVTGTTTLPGTSVAGNAAPDHYWHFSLSQETAVTFDGCASQYDTWIRIMNRGLGSEVVGCDDCGGCSTTTRSRLAAVLPAGDYSVVMDGFGSSAGSYTMLVDCPNNEPTYPPTSPPTNPPTSPPTNPPTSYCPAGYTDLPDRYYTGMGMVTIVSSHQQCADRCTQFSDPLKYMGGCKGYMTGMYSGMLYCRSYGGWNAATQACAPWANPENPGYYSGLLGSFHPQTGQVNVGGNCCTNITSAADSGFGLSGFGLAMSNNIETTTDEPDTDGAGTDGMMPDDSDSDAAALAASTDSDDDDAHRRDIIGAIIGTLGVVAMVGAVVFVRHQRTAGAPVTESAPDVPNPVFTTDRAIGDSGRSASYGDSLNAVGQGY